jgi:4-hydroxy-4-methyl-2-oxoglutarate aldolase
MVRPQIYTRITEPDAALMQEAGEIGVSDLHEGLGAVLGRTLLMSAAMRPLDPSKKIAGPAVTAYNYPGDNLATHQAINLLRPGNVLVMSNGGEMQGAQAGELTGLQAKRNGAAGMLCHGSVRDTQALVEMGLPVWSTAIHPSHPEKRGPCSVNVPIVVDGVMVHPGDIVVADADGVIVIPPDLLGVAMENARQRRDREIQTRARLAEGETLYDMFEIGKAVKASGADMIDAIWTRSSK